MLIMYQHDDTACMPISPACSTPEQMAYWLAQDPHWGAEMTYDQWLSIVWDAVHDVAENIGAEYLPTIKRLLPPAVPLELMTIEEVQEELDKHWYARERYYQNNIFAQRDGAPYEAALKEYALAYARYFALLARKIEHFAAISGDETLSWIEGNFGMDEREILYGLSIPIQSSEWKK